MSGKQTERRMGKMDGLAQALSIVSSVQTLEEAKKQIKKAKDNVLTMG